MGPYFRLWPAYLVVLVATLTILYSGSLHVLAQMRPSTIMFIGFSNFSLFFQDLFFLLRFEDGSWFPPRIGAPARLAPTRPPDRPAVLDDWRRADVLSGRTIRVPYVRGTTALFLFGLATRLCLGAFATPGLEPWLYRFALRK